MMGYRIEYDWGNGKYEVREDHPWRFSLMLVGAFGIFLLFAPLFWPERVAAVRSVLIPGDDAVTVQAIRNMTDDLRSGATLQDALEAFCRFVVHGQ